MVFSCQNTNMCMANMNCEMLLKQHSLDVHHQKEEFFSKLFWTFSSSVSSNRLSLLNVGHIDTEPVGAVKQIFAPIEAFESSNVGAPNAEASR